METAIRGKRLLLFKEMPEQYITTTTPTLVCWMSFAKFWLGWCSGRNKNASLQVYSCSAHWRRAEDTVQVAKGKACWRCLKVRWCRHRWNQTLLEVERGWLRGPLEWAEVPEDAPVSKRFELRQKHKIRLIDDFSESSGNQTVSVHDSGFTHCRCGFCCSVFLV